MENSPIFWNTQGEIKFDKEENYFNYETFMSVNWHLINQHVKVLITIMNVFLNRPSILDVQNGKGVIWTNTNLKNSIFYKLPVIFKEIILRDEYILDENNVYNPNYNFSNYNFI